MAFASTSEKPKQNPEIEQKTFSELLEAYMQAKGFRGAKLAEESNLSPAMISRMLNNTNSRGKPFHPALEDILAISIALGIGEEGYNELVNAAFPSLSVGRYALAHGLTLVKTNLILDEQGLPPLGREPKELIE